MTKRFKEAELFILNLPDPPSKSIYREYAGGFGTAVQALPGHWKHSTAPILNLFLPYSVAVAKEVGCEYEVLDAQALNLTASDIIGRVKNFDPNVVISMVSLPAIHDDVRLLNNIKEELPDILVVAFGTVCKVIPDTVLQSGKIEIVSREDFPYVNSLWMLLKSFQQTGTLNLKKLPEFSYVERSKVIHNPPPLNKREFTDFTPLYDDLPLQKYESFIDLEGKWRQFIPILASKGCAHNCYYCPYPVGFGRKPIFENPKTVVNQVEHLHNHQSVEGFLFRNQSFTMNAEWARKVCLEIIKRKLQISWFCEARTDETFKENLRLMQRSGCKRIGYGVETGDPELIKTAKPGTSLRKVYKTFKVSKELGIWTHAHVILGLLGETEQTLERTSEFLLELDPESVSLNFATPYPATGLYRMASRDGWIVTRNWENYSSSEVVMRTERLSVKRLYQIRKKLKKRLLSQRISRLLSNPFRNHAFNLLTNYYLPALTAEIYRPL